jgi:hypothetical protein
MSNETQLSDEDNGKRVVNSQGEQVGRVVELSGDVAYVAPTPEPTMAGDGDPRSGPDENSDDRRFPIEQDEIDSITRDEISLTR